MKLAGHKLKEVERNELVKTYLVFDSSQQRERPIRGDDIVEEGTVVYKNGKHWEIFLYDFVHNVCFLEEVIV